MRLDILDEEPIEVCFVSASSQGMAVEVTVPITEALALQQGEHRLDSFENRDRRTLHNYPGPPQHGTDQSVDVEARRIHIATNNNRLTIVPRSNCRKKRFHLGGSLFG